MEKLVKRYDVVVVGWSSAGVAPALAAGRLGARAALLEDTPVAGGMLANPTADPAATGPILDSVLACL